MDLAIFNLLPLTPGKGQPLEAGPGAYGVGLPSRGASLLKPEFQALLGGYLEGSNTPPKKAFFLWLSTQIKGLLSKATQAPQLLTDSEKEFLGDLLQSVEEILSETGGNPLTPAMKASASEGDIDDAGGSKRPHEKEGPFVGDSPFVPTMKGEVVHGSSSSWECAQAEANEKGGTGVEVMVGAGDGRAQINGGENITGISGEKGGISQWNATVVGSALVMEESGERGQAIVDEAFFDNKKAQLSPMSDAEASSRGEVGEINRSFSPGAALTEDRNLLSLLEAVFRGKDIAGAGSFGGADLKRVKDMLHSILRIRGNLGKVDATNTLPSTNAILIDEVGDRLLSTISPLEDDAFAGAIAGQARPMDNETPTAVNLDKGRTSWGPDRIFEGGNRDRPILLIESSHAKKDVLHQGPSHSQEAPDQGGEDTPLKGLVMQVGAARNEALEETSRFDAQKGTIGGAGDHKTHSTADSRHGLSGLVAESDAASSTFPTSNGKDLDGTPGIHISSDVREEIVGVVARRVTNALDKGEHIVKIRLHPPELGRIHVELRVEHEGNRVRATFLADVNEVKGLLQQHHHLLKETLVQHGYQLHDFSVHSLAPDADLDSGLGWFGGTGSGYETGTNDQNNAPWQKGEAPQVVMDRDGSEGSAGMASREGGASGTGISIRV